MKRELLLVVLVPLLGFGGAAVWGPGGGLAIVAPEVTFNGSCFTLDWRHVQGVGLDEPDAAGTVKYQLQMKDGETVDVEATVAQGENNDLRVSYVFTPRSEIEINSFFVGCTIPVHQIAGGRWVADSETGVFPVRLGKAHFLGGKFRTLRMFWPEPGRDELAITFEEPTPVMIQDNRQWDSDSYSIRLGSAGRKKFAAGVPYKVAFRVASGSRLNLTYDRHVVLQAGPEWVEIVNEREIEPGSALDFSVMGFTDAPAGKHGWLKAVGPHFEFEKKPGVPQRFYGVNFCFSACFPSAEQAEILADRILRLGYNSIRIHHHDNSCVQGSTDGLTLNAEQMARLDGFLAACYKRGLYVTTDLFVSRRVMWRHIGIDRDGQVEMQVFKALIAVHEPAFQNWAAFARAFLNHVNPHTGRRYADEPAMPLLAMINEGSIGYVVQEARDTPAMQAAWVAWLKAKRAKDTAFGDIPEQIPHGMRGKAGAAAALFIADTEARMVARMKAFLREEIGCRALISNYNCGTHYTTLQPVREDLYDYVDDHFYVDHPQFLVNKWQLPSRCGNVNPIFDLCPIPGRVAFTRLTNKPFTVTEYNFSGPGMYRGVGGILTGAMGALQEWSGMWRFAYSHNLAHTFADGHAGYFDLVTDPLAQTSDRATVCLYLRGDLSPAAESLTIILPRQEVATMSEQAQRVAPSWSVAAWQARVGTRVADAPVEGERALVFQEAYNGGDKLHAALDAATNRVNGLVMDQVRGAFTITTERTCGGFVESGSFSAGPLAVAVSGAPATVWVSSLDRSPVVTGKRLLLAHLTDVQSTDRKFAEKARKTLLAWGKLPNLVRQGQAAVALALDKPETYKVYALATSGRRMGQMPSVVKDGRLCFDAVVAGPHGTCLMYEIERGY